MRAQLLLILCLLPSLTACDSSDTSGEGPQILYVALGASDATGIGAIPPTEGYVFLIEDGIEEETGRDVELVNLGIPGADADDIEEIELAVFQELEQIELITLFTGGNDLVGGRSPEEFEQDLAAILAETSRTPAFTVIANLPNLTESPRFVAQPDDDVTAERIAAFNAAIQRQANNYGLPVIDLFSLPVENFLFSADGFHPSNEGHRLLADLFLEVIIPVVPML